MTRFYLVTRITFRGKWVPSGTHFGMKWAYK
jgi:hypothetical protein